MRSEGTLDPSGYGILGGSAGKCAEVTLQPAGGEPFVPPQYGLLELPEAHLTIVSAGGGGVGDPKRRSPDAVLADVRDEIVSAESAR